MKLKSRLSNLRAQLEGQKRAKEKIEVPVVAFITGALRRLLRMAL